MFSNISEAFSVEDVSRNGRREILRIEVEAVGEAGETVGERCGGEIEAGREVFFIGGTPEGYAVNDIIPGEDTS